MFTSLFLLLSNASIKRTLHFPSNSQKMSKIISNSKNTQYSHRHTCIAVVFKSTIRGLSNDFKYREIVQDLMNMNQYAVHGFKCEV